MIHYTPNRPSSLPPSVWCVSDCVHPSVDQGGSCSDAHMQPKKYWITEHAEPDACCLTYNLYILEQARRSDFCEGGLKISNYKTLWETVGEPLHLVMWVFILILKQVWPVLSLMHLCRLFFSLIELLELCVVQLHLKAKVFISVPISCTRMQGKRSEGKIGITDVSQVSIQM